jgi:ABC-2 type transport system permease protein
MSGATAIVQGRATNQFFNPAITFATTRRVLGQLRRDHRTVGLMMGVPLVLLTLLWWIFEDNRVLFNRVGPALLALFPFVVMFLVTSVATLRERTSGTLERLLTMPLAKLDLLLGYGIAFALVAVVQAGLATALMLGPLGLELAGPAWMLVLVAVLDAVLGSALGLFLSAFARTEFQAVQFMPAFVLPQFLLCGLLVPREQMDDILRWISNVLPLSYAVDAMQQLTRSADFTADLGRDLVIVGGCIVLALLLGAATLKRRTP